MQAPLGRCKERNVRQKQRSRAGSPGCFFLCCTPGSVLVRRPRRFRSCLRPQFFLNGGASMAACAVCHRYITKARFSSSCCKTGKAQPDISTRLAASIAA